MHIVQIASELTPIAKVGGLADVVYGLSKELVRLGQTVEILLPKYDCIDFTLLDEVKIEDKDVEVSDGDLRLKNTIWSARLHGIKLLFVESHHPHSFFNRAKIYGCHDDADRFTYFCKVGLAYLFKAKKKIDVLHAHDWPAALAPILIEQIYRPLGLVCKKTVFTIHNMEHQGRCDPQILLNCGIPVETLRDPYYPSVCNLLKGGIEYAEQITTVSPNYEKEIQTPEGGFGLDQVLVKNRGKLKGILNGIDEEFWNPEKDIHLAKKYPTRGICCSTLPKLIEGKKKNKEHLRTHLHMKQEDRPLVACVTRLVLQKGPELIKHALLRTLEKGGQFILLDCSQPLSFIRNWKKSAQPLRGKDRERFC